MSLGCCPCRTHAEARLRLEPLPAWVEQVANRKPTPTRRYNQTKWRDTRGGP